MPMLGQAGATIPCATNFGGYGSFAGTRKRVPSLRGALATKQSIHSWRGRMDCFASLAMTRREETPDSGIHVHEIAQQRIDLVVPALAREHAVMADAGLHVMNPAVGAD